MSRTNKRTTVKPGIYRDAYGYSVFASVGSRARRLTSPEERFSLDTPIGELEAAVLRHKAGLKAEQAKAGGPLKRGLVSGDCARYLATATIVEVPGTRGSMEWTQRRYDEYEQVLGWWSEKFGARRRDALESAELLKALNGLVKADGKPASGSTKNKYRQTFSHVWTILDGKNAANPFRDIQKFDEGDPEERDQPYELIDAIMNQIRDRGRGKAPSRTKAFLLCEAYAPVTRAQLLRMDRDSFSAAAMTLTVPSRRKGKGARGRTKPISADGVDALQ